MFSLLTNSTVSSFPDAFWVIQLPTSCPFALNTLVFTDKSFSALLLFTLVTTDNSACLESTLF